MTFRRQPNLLFAKEHYCRPAPWRLSLKITLAAALIFGILAIAVAPFVVAGVRLYGAALSGRTQLYAAQTALSRLDWSVASSNIEAASRDFREAQTQLAKLQLLSFIPPIGNRLEAVASLLEGGSAVTAAGRELVAVGERVFAAFDQATLVSQALVGQLPDLGTVFRDLTPERKREMLAAVSAGVPQLRQAVQELERADASLERLAMSAWATEFLPTVEPLRAKLTSAHDLIVALLPIAETLPTALGFPEAKNYLLIFQNHTELRPSGGFLSLVGLLQLANADLQSVSVENVYKYDVAVIGSELMPAPPEPLRRYVGLDKLYLRDANWQPDFTAASETILKLWRIEYAARFSRPAPVIDGVIAVTPKLAEDILQLTGPVTVGDQTFTAATLVDDLEFQVEQGFVQQGIPWEERKDIVNDLVLAVIERVSAMPLQQLLALLDIVHQDLRQGHVLLSAADPQLQSVILAQDWGGAFRPVVTDYVTVIDANLGSLKTDAVIDRSVAYAIEPDGQGGFLGRVAMTYRNNGSFTWKTTRYRTYVRVYLPADSELLGATGQLIDDKLKSPSGKPGTVDVGDEFGRRWFGAFTSTEPGRTNTIEFRFKLAPTVAAAIASGNYELTVEKQPGTLDPKLTLDLAFGKPIASATPGEVPSEFGDDRYRVVSDLLTDRTFEVKMR